MNHLCPCCKRSNLSETDFDFTLTGRRRKNCRCCYRAIRSRDNRVVNFNRSMRKAMLI